MRSKFGVSPSFALEFYNLSVVKFNVCKVLLMPLSVASLKQLLASFLQVYEYEHLRRAMMQKSVECRDLS